MKESVVDCLFLKSATKLAHEKGLLPKRQLLKCEFENTCTGLECIKINNLNYRTIKLKQCALENSVSPVDKFYGRLIKRKNMLSND